MLPPACELGFGVKIERDGTQLVHRKPLDKAMTGGLETPAIVPKIVPRCFAQAIEKLLIGVRLRQVRVVFPQAAFIVLDLGILGIESPGGAQLLDGLKFVATRQNP